MPKLVSPTGETVTSSHAGAALLLKRGYTDPTKPAAKKRAKKTEQPADEKTEES